MPSDRSAAQAEQKLVYIVGVSSHFMNGDPGLTQPFNDEWFKHQDASMQRQVRLHEHEQHRLSSVLPTLLKEGWLIKTVHAVSNHGHNEEALSEGAAAAYVVLERPIVVADFKIGDKVRGKIIRHDEQTIFLDLWGKVTGCLSRDELPADVQPEVDGSVDVIVSDNRVRNGCIRVTRGPGAG